MFLCSITTTISHVIGYGTSSTMFLILTKMTSIRSVMLHELERVEEEDQDQLAAAAVVGDDDEEEEEEEDGEEEREGGTWEIEDA